MSQDKRRHHSPEDKVKILRLHLLEGKPISEVCEEHGIHPTLFYQWQRQFFENGARAFDNAHARARAESALEGKVEALEKRLQRKDEVMAMLLEEHTRLKKELGED
jgi:transposase-like protein